MSYFRLDKLAVFGDPALVAQRLRLTGLRHVLAGLSDMQLGLCKGLILLTCYCASSAQADATLTFRLSGPEQETSTKIISLSRFFARIEDPSTPEHYLIYQAGKFFPLYEVDRSAKSYRRLSEEVNATLETGLKAEEKDSLSEAGESKSKLKATKKQLMVAGIGCRVVKEIRNDSDKIDHCMADKSRLGMTEREVRTLARVFTMAREQGYAWVGTSTEDEKFVSIKSRDPSRNMTLELVSVSTDPLTEGYLRIPREYRQSIAEVKSP